MDALNVPARELMPVLREALQRGQRVRLAATGGSMWPFVRHGDIVELEPLAGLPRVGDVVLFEEGEGRYILHRVVWAGAGLFTARGDAQRAAAGPFAASCLLGRVIRVYRAGRCLAFATGPWRLAGLLWVHLSPLGLPLLSWLSRTRTLRLSIFKHRSGS